MLNRNRGEQKINKPKTVKTEEAKNFSKSEAEMIDVIDTLQRLISIIDRRWPRTQLSFRRELTRNTNNTTVTLIIRKTSMFIAFSKQCQFEAYPEQISDVSCGNTTVLIGIDQLLLERGIPTTIEDAHTNVDDGRQRSLEDCNVVQGQKRQHSTLINLLRNKQICICVDRMNCDRTDCDTADNKQEKFDEISNEMKNVSNKMTSWKESIHNPQNCWSE